MKADFCNGSLQGPSLEQPRCCGVVETSMGLAMFQMRSQEPQTAAGANHDRLHQHSELK